MGEKVRRGDREVALAIADISKVRQRPVILIDDMISSGTTLIACARLLREAGATNIQAVATHSLASNADLARLAEEGITGFRATDSTSSSASSIPLAGVLAEAIRNQGWLL